MRLPNIKKYMDKKNRMRFVYAKYYTGEPVDEKTILFESFHGKEISDSPLAMARALLDMPCAGGYRLWFSTNDLDRDKDVLKRLRLNDSIGLVHIHSEEYAKLLATAGLMINNSSFPSYIVRREGQKYLQTWHGTPWKTLGCSMKGELASIHNSQHNFIQASHLLFPNEFTKETMMHDYVLNDIYTGKVITYGYPRCAMFCDKAKAAEVKKACGDEAFSTIAYMPTWRGQDNRNIETGTFVEDTLIQLRAMDEALADDQKLYVNLHPIVQSDIDLGGFRHIHPFPKDVEKYEFINSMDALITDYSSVFFDYSITGKPVILFTYDYDNYASERGMYFGIEELPFARVDTLEDLAEMFRTRSYEKLSYENDKAYHDKFIKYDTVTAAADVMSYMLECSADGLDSNVGAASKLRIEDFSFNAGKPRRIVNCREVPGRLDMDILAKELRSDDVAVFHQAGFDIKAGDRLKELYDGKFPYVFTTEAVPQTMAESRSGSKAVKADVKERNLRRQVGRLTVDKVVEHKLSRTELVKIKTKGSMLMLSLKTARIGQVRGVVLEYRSGIESIKHRMDFSVKGDTIEASMDMSVLKHGCLYWDIYVEAGEGDNEYQYPVMLSKRMRKTLRRGYYQCELGDYIAFPHISLSRSLAFTLREKSPYDDRVTRLKEVLVPSWSIIWSRLNRRRRIWLVFEKFCSAAQDNGFYFFKWCMENLPADKRKDIYYVIDKSAKDYENLKPYAGQVLQFMSFRHLLYAINAKVYVGSDSRKHLYAWRPKPNLISIRMAARPIHFLQHGVTALKRTDGLFGAKGSSPMTHITTTSDYEQRIMDEFWGYSPSNAPVLGFTRWDVLEDKSTPEDKTILVMPTWRAWLEEKPDEDFIASDYFRNYMEMLGDERLNSCLEGNGAKLIFFIHPKFKDYLGRFSAPSENIELVQFGSRPLNEIMMKCRMLITDYSSVCWDVYYMGKPVIFYQFDYDMYMGVHGSYLDMEHDLFGDRYTELDDVIEGIRTAIENGFQESERAREMRPKYFKYIDSDNSKRTYEYLRKKGY